MRSAHRGRGQVHLHSHAPYNVEIPPPSYQQASAPGAAQHSESKQLFRTGISSEISEPWLQGAGTEPELFPRPLWTNGNWRLK